MQVDTKQFRVMSEEYSRIVGVRTDWLWLGSLGSRRAPLSQSHILGVLVTAVSTIN